jgi:alpha-beta hydrolase superfamily lysophospholipase
MIVTMHSEIVKLAGGKLTGQLRYKKPVGRLIIVCHGYKSSSGHPAIMAITEGLNKKGYATFAFNFSDESGLNLEQQVNDIVHIVNHFKGYSEIILMAGSFGALSTATVAAKLPKVKGLVTINGFFGSGKLGRKHLGTFMIFKFLTVVSPRHKKTWSYFKREFQPARITAPVLVMHAESDKLVPIVQSRNFFEKLTCVKQFTPLEKADHHLTSAKDIDSILDAVNTWLL